MKLKGKTALITGGGRGIGRAIAIAFAAEGARVCVVARTEEEIRGVAREIEDAYDTEAIYARCDVSSVAEVERACESALARFESSVDVLVNSAGIAESAPLVRTDDELWDRHLAVNLTGTFYFTRACLPAMIERRWGRVINIASVAGKVGAPYISAYAAAKHGVLGLTRSVALEVARQGVTVNAICPGYAETDMAEHAIENIVSRTGRSVEEARAALERMSPQQRLMTPDEIAALALLLASEEGRGITGQAINVDGGSVLY